MAGPYMEYEGATFCLLTPDELFMKVIPVIEELTLSLPPGVPEWCERLVNWRMRLLFHPEDEAAAVEVFDLDAGILFQEFAQLGDIDVHGAGGEVIVVLPDDFQGLRSGKQGVFMFAQ